MSTNKFIIISEKKNIIPCYGIKWNKKNMKLKILREHGVMKSLDSLIPSITNHLVYDSIPLTFWYFSFKHFPRLWQKTKLWIMEYKNSITRSLNAHHVSNNVSYDMVQW